MQRFLTSLCLILDLVAVSYRKYGILTTIIALSGKDTKVTHLDFGELDQIVGVNIWPSPTEDSIKIIGSPERTPNLLDIPIFVNAES